MVKSKVIKIGFIQVGWTKDLIGISFFDKYHYIFKKQLNK